MIKLKVLSSALSLAILCSAPVAHAESTVVGQLVASPSAIVSAGASQHKIGSQAVSYIQGDTITTGSDANATVSLTSGSAKLVVAPNTVMSVTDASAAQFSLEQGAFSVQAKEGQAVTVETAIGSFELVSPVSIDALVSFQNGDFVAVSKNGLLTVASQSGVVTSVDAGNAFVFNDKGATSVDVQEGLAGGAGAGLNTALIVAGIVVATVVVADSVSDADDAEVDDSVASPAQ